MRLQNMTWPALQKALKPETVALLPLGSLETHGRHLPLGTDTLVPRRLAVMIEARCPRALVLPEIPYGCCDSQTEFPGTVSLGTDVLEGVVRGVADAMLRLGVRRIAVLNGHGGNVGALDRVALDLRRRGAALAELNWWRYVWDINPAWKGGHGGGEETAAILAVDESLVDTSAYEPAQMHGISPELPAAGWDDVAFRGVSVPVPRPDRTVTPNGWLGPDPLETASRAWGESMLTAAADYAAEFITALERMELYAD